MLTLKDLESIKTTFCFTMYETPPILFPLFPRIEKDDHLYCFMKEHYKTIDNDFFETYETFKDYYRDWHAESHFTNIEWYKDELSNILKTYIDLISSFLIISWFIHLYLNEETRAALENLFKNFQDTCNKDDVYKIKQQLVIIISKDNFLTKYKKLILYQDPVLEAYNRSKTNKSKHNQETIKALSRISKGYLEHCAQTSSKIPKDIIFPFRNNRIKAPDTLEFSSKSLINVTKKYRNKEHSKYNGVIKLPNMLKIDLNSLFLGNEVMRIYWNDERALSYGNQVSKVAGRIYRLIQANKNKQQLTSIEKALLELKPLEIKKYIRESFELSIYPD